MGNIQTLMPLGLIVILSISFAPVKLFAQTINRDSLRREAFARDSIKQDSIAEAIKIRNLARWDSRKQRLNTAETIRFKADDKNSHSDLFKPRKQFVSDTSLLLDSVYVKAFRKAAYETALDDNPKIEKCIWLAFGFGGNFGSNDNGGGINLFANANFEFYRQLIVSPDIHVASSLFGGTSEESYSILFGKIFKQEYSFIMVSTGLAFDQSQSNDNSSLGNISGSGIGIPFLIQVYVVMGQAVGLGIGAYADLSTNKSTAGITIGLAFGKLTTHERK
jgi:hypothetical protein